MTHLLLSRDKPVLNLFGQRGMGKLILEQGKFPVYSLSCYLTSAVCCYPNPMISCRYDSLSVTDRPDYRPRDQQNRKDRRDWPTRSPSDDLSVIGIHKVFRVPIAQHAAFSPTV